MSVSILFPYKSDHGGRRDELFSFSLRRWKAIWPDAELCVGITTDTYFNRSKAINLAAQKSHNEMLVIADTDTVIEESALRRAIDEARAENRMMFPYTAYCKLSEETTSDLLSRAVDTTLSQIHFPPEKIETGYVSGVVVVPRNIFFAAGGFDDRFEDWGCEDEAFYWAVKTLVGRAKRIEGSVFHLWHPPAPASITRDGKYSANKAHLFKYQSAAEYPAIMKILCRVGRKTFVETSVNPAASQALVGLGHASLKMQRFEEAEKILIESLEANVNNAHAWFFLGVCRMQQNDPEGANRYFDQCIATDPNSVLAWRAKAQCFGNLGKVTESEICFQKAFEVSGAPVLQLRS
jgi:tetratricopeptide (TPR) repeat protein